MGGVNLVAGFRPELWREAVPDDAPASLEGFNEDLIGVDGFVMPATQHDAVLWLSGSAYDVVFDVGRAAIAELQGLASVVEDTSSWPYRHDLDLTGFIDGTENPTLIDAPELVLIPDGKPGAGGTILLLQKWAHDSAEWESLPVAKQELVIGGGSSTASSSRTSRRTPTLRAPTRTASARSSGGTCLTGRSPTTARCSSASARAAAALDDAGEHGRTGRRRARRAHALHAAAHRRLLLRPVDGLASSTGRPRALARPRARTARPDGIA